MRRKKPVAASAPASSSSSSSVGAGSIHLRWRECALWKGGQMGDFIAQIKIFGRYFGP